MPTEDEDYPKTFGELWSMCSGMGVDVKGFAEKFYEEAKKVGLSRNLIESIVGLCVEMKGLDDYYTETFAEKSEVASLQKKFGKHKHAPSGEAMQPL